MGFSPSPSPHPTMGKEMEHTATVLLFDRDGKLAGTIARRSEFAGRQDTSALGQVERA